MSEIIILTPVFDDWECFYQLSKEIGTIFHQECLVLAVNDNSVQPADPTILETLTGVSVVNLAVNVGHQRAIAIGLSYIWENLKGAKLVVVMDSDGEDRPADIPLLIDESKRREHQAIIFARRGKRKKGMGFDFFYQGYKFFFTLLTGKRIAFGNFCCLPAPLLEKIVRNPDIWNHFSAGIMRSRLPYAGVKLNRGDRYSGKSKMNLPSLFVHGLSAIAVYLETVSARLFIASISLILLSLAGIGVVVSVRLFTNLAVPGWATYVSLLIINIVFQLFLFCMILVFITLYSRSAYRVPPLFFYRNYILSVDNQ